MSSLSSTHYSQIDHFPATTGHANDLEVAAGERLQIKNTVLHVIDAPYDGSTPQLCARFSLNDDIAEGMRNLPPHRSGTARILDVTTHTDFIITGLRDTKGPKETKPARDVLIQFLEDTYTQSFEERRIFRWLNDPLLVNDIGSISSQWSQRLGSGNTSFYRLVNRSSLQQDPLDADLHPRDSYLTCAQDENDRLIAIIVNDVSSVQRFPINRSPADDIFFRNPRTTSNILQGTSWTSHSDGSVDTFAKLLVLDFFTASIYLQPVDYYGPLIYSHLPDELVLKLSITKNPHLQVPLGLFEPRLSAKSKEAFKEIVDAEGILRSVHNLVDSINFVIEDIKDNNTAGTAARPEFKRRMKQLDELCKERGSNAKRALEALNRQLDYLTKKHAISEAKAIRILTILASLYLPLSLSASVLGMQSPFKEVAHTLKPGDQMSDPRLVGTNLLFDFFGVFIGLGAVTIFILYAIRFGLWVKSEGLGIISKNFIGPFSILQYGKRWRFPGQGGRLFNSFRAIAVAWTGAGVCITLLVTFMMGMLKGAQKAWDTARWMFAAYLIGCGVWLLCCAGTYWFLHRKNLRTR